MRPGIGASRGVSRGPASSEFGTANRFSTVLLRPPRAARASVSPVSRCAPGRGLPIAQSAPPPGPHAAGPRPHRWQPKTPPQAKPTLRHTTPTGRAVPGRSVVRKPVWHDCKRRAVTSPRWLQRRGGMTVMRRARNHPGGRSRRPGLQIIFRPASACRPRDLRITGVSRSGYSAAAEAAKGDGLGFEQRGAASLMGSAPMQG